MGLKEKILAVERKIIRVVLPEIDEPVYVKVLTGAEHEAYQKELEALKGVAGMRPLIVAYTVCDAAGRRLFDDASELDAVSTTVLERLCHVALKINGMTKEARDEYEKNC